MLEVCVLSLWITVIAALTRMAIIEKRLSKLEKKEKKQGV